MSKKVSDILPKTEILAQLAEEASELAQAALKLRRALDDTNPTPKSVAECEANLIEEFADISKIPSMAITLTLALLTIGIGITKRRFNTNNLGAGSGLLFEDMTAKRKQKPGTICG